MFLLAAFLDRLFHGVIVVNTGGTMYLLMLANILLTTPATAADETLGVVLNGPIGEDVWLFRYEDKSMECRVTSLCTGLKPGGYFVPAFKFSRQKELIDYIGLQNKWNDCVLHSCEEY